MKFARIRVLPARALLACALFWLLIGLAASIWPSAEDAWLDTGLALLVVALADLIALWQRGAPLHVERLLPHAWPVGVAETVTLVLEARGAALSGTVFDQPPPAFAPVGLPLSFRLPAGGRAEYRYRCTAAERGDYSFGAPQVRLRSLARLWQWQLDAAVPDTPVRVLPDFARIAHYALLATDQRLAQLGLIQRRRRGEGLEFEQLREYREGDALRQIDWKASARMNRLIAREYQDERNQQILFVLDCGLRMRGREAAQSAVRLSHFDHAVNAMLLLAFVALRQGDAAGFATFATPDPRLVPPRRGAGTLRHLTEAVYDLQPTHLTPDYDAMTVLVGQRVRRRALIVILTNLRDEDDETLVPAVRRLSRQHRVVVASLREPGLALLSEKPVRTFDDALAYAAASEYLYDRRRTVKALHHAGTAALDVAPAELPMALVNQYWALKRSGVL